MNRHYFYIKENQKIGPVDKEQLISEIEENTLIWFEGLDDWRKALEIEEFRDLLSSVTPPLPIDNTKTSHQNYKFKHFLIFVLLAIIASGIAYFKTKQFRESDYAELNNKIDKVFNGKDEIRDFTKSGVIGELTKVSDSPLTKLQVGSKSNENSDIYEFFGCESGGWTVYCLKKLKNGYEYVEHHSTDMGFKVPESTYHQGTDFGHGYKSRGYSIPTYRGTVQNAYNEAMNYISVDNENNSYVAGAHDKIITFDELSGQLYYIDNIRPTKISSASVNSKDWRSSGEACVYNKNWVVWHIHNGKHYEIVLDKERYKRNMILNIGIANGFALLVILIWILFWTFFLKKS